MILLRVPGDRSMTDATRAIVLLLGFDLCEKGSTLSLHRSCEGKRTAFYFFVRLLLFELTRAHNSTAFRISIYNNTILF